MAKSNNRKNQNPLDKVLLALLPDFDIQQYERMHPHLQVLFQTVIPTSRLPAVGVERYRDGLAKVVQLETGRSQGGHDGSVVNSLIRDLSGSSSENEIGVGGGSGKILVGGRMNRVSE